MHCPQDFDAVVESCFSSFLESDYFEKINKFKKSYCDLSISITPKVHAVFFMFCKKHKKGLRFFSEEAMESVQEYNSEHV